MGNRGFDCFVKGVALLGNVESVGENHLLYRVGGLHLPALSLEV